MVQEQNGSKSRKIFTYIGLCGLIDKTILDLSENAKKTNKLCMKWPIFFKIFWIKLFIFFFY